MNTPEQIAEKWAKSLATGRLDNFGAIKSAIEEATQPLHQRLIAAEVQASVVKEEIEYLIKEAHLWHQKPRLNRIHQAINNSPSPRTYEAFTAMMKVCQAIQSHGHLDVQSCGCPLELDSALKQAKEVGVV